MKKEKKKKKLKIYMCYDHLYHNGLYFWRRLYFWRPLYMIIFMTKEKMTLDRVNAFLTNIINGQPGTIDIRDTIGAKKIDAKTKKLPILKKL